MLTRGNPAKVVSGALFFTVRKKLALSFWSTHQFQPNRPPAPKTIRNSAAELQEQTVEKLKDF